MRSSMIPLAVPNLSGNEEKYLTDCISTGYVSSVGQYVRQFEGAVAAAAGTGYAVATSAGTTALHLGLTALGVRSGDLVLLPSLTFIASANAISHAGARPWLIDVSSESWTICPDRLRETLETETQKGPNGVVHRESGRRVAAIVPVFTLGLPADMDPVCRLSEEWDIPVLVDGAAALGASYKGHRSGACGAAATMYSFNGNKTVTAGGGGILATDDAELARLARHLSTTARSGDDYDHDMVGFNYRMTNLQAAVGCAQMEQLDLFVKKKQTIRARYDRAFTGHDAVEAFPEPDWATSACWFSGFLYRAAHPDVLRQKLRDRGIDARPFWKPIHLQKPYLDCPRSDMSVCEALWQSVITLPSSTGMTDHEMELVIAAVNEALG